MTVTTVEKTLYSHWASALVNGDESGLDDTETFELHAFMREMISQHGSCFCVDVSEDHWFGRPDTNGLPGNVATFTFIL